MKTLFSHRGTEAQRGNFLEPLSLCVSVAICVLFSGCARFTTNQTQNDVLSPDGKTITRVTTTRASATTFFEAKSSLANFKASQTDKTQSATVGALNQEASGSNAVALTEAVVRGATSAALQFMVPKTP